MKGASKYLVIYKNKDKYAIVDMCGFFGVSRSGYYNYVKKIDKPHKDEYLAKIIIECQEKSRKTYGYRRVAIWIQRNKGVIINHKRILRVMNKYGLLSEIRRRKKYKHMGSVAHKYENILNRNFYDKRPNQKWVTDISYIHTNEWVLYLSIIRDLFDQSIVSYKMATSQNTNFVLTTIKEAYSKQKITTGL